MSKHANVTGAESCWDDGFEDDSDCEQYLQKQKAKLIAESDDDSDEFEDEEVSEESEEEDTDEIHDSAADDAEDDESEESEETAETDEESEDATVAKGKKMVKAKTSSKMTKADAIRAIIAAKQEAGVEIKPRDIKAALEKKGIEVNSSQISITLRAMGVPPTRKGSGRRAGSKASSEETAEPKKRATARFKAVAAETDGQEAVLDHAADLLKMAGSYDAAVSALNLCRKIMARD